jgi:hypothetical protein
MISFRGWHRRHWEYRGAAPRGCNLEEESIIITLNCSLFTTHILSDWGPAPRPLSAGPRVLWRKSLLAPGAFGPGGKRPFNMKPYKIKSSKV